MKFKDTLKLIFKNNNHILYLSLIATLITISLFYKIGIVYFILWLLCFTVYDTIVFGIIIKNMYPNDSWPKSVILFYRISQLTIQFLLTLFLVLSGYTYIAIGVNIAWWFTFCDFLYYKILKIELPMYDNGKLYEYFWLSNWSIFLPLKYINIKPTRKNFLILSFIGLFIGLIASII